MLIGRCGLLLSLLTLLLANVQPCEAQSFALPFDVHQGLVVGASHPRTPYLFEARVSPGLDLGPVRFSAVLAPTYVNPRWDLALGGEVSLFGVIALRRFGVRLAMEGVYLPWLGNARVSMGLMGDAFGLVRIGVWPGVDFATRRVLLTTSIGVDVMSWIDLMTRE
jgi:hypothetical protein